MEFLPDDLKSFTWGAVAVLVIGALIKGFAEKFGGDVYKRLKQAIPHVPEEMEVDPHYQSPECAQGGCSWVRAHRLAEFEANHATYVRHASNGKSKCYRNIQAGGVQVREYLMKVPA
jgi:hypothetical protein